MPKRPTANKNNAQSAAPFKYDGEALLRGFIVLIISLGLFIYVLEYTNWSLLYRLIAALAVFFAGGFLLDKSGGLQEAVMGGRMMKSHVGLKLMDSLSKRSVWFWNGLSDWGLVLGFGLLSYFIFKKTISKKMILFGALSIIFMILVLLPYSVIGFSFINISQITSRVNLAASSSTPGPVNYLLYLIAAVAIAGGFVAYIAFALLENGVQILYAIGVALTTIFTSTPNYAPLNQSIPGIAPILPGLGLPLVQGLLAIIVVLSIHEFAHGILGRIAKMNIMSSGLLVYGIIPLGAFVELDEKKVGKLSVQQQNRISVAGVASNMLLFVLFFIPTFLLAYYIIPSVQTSYVYVVSVAPNSPANGMIAANSIILKWNNYNISTISDFKTAAVGDTPGAKVSVVTNETSAVLTANSTGKVGVYVEQVNNTKPGIIPWLVVFSLPFFALAFLLNFLIAIANYLPIPGLDGWRIFSLNIKNRKITFGFGAGAILILGLNALPWAWILPIVGIPANIILFSVIYVVIRWLWDWSNEKVKI